MYAWEKLFHMFIGRHVQNVYSKIAFNNTKLKRSNSYQWQNGYLNYHKAEYYTAVKINNLTNKRININESQKCDIEAEK